MNFSLLLLVLAIFKIASSSENESSKVKQHLSLKCGQDGHKCSLLIAQVIESFLLLLLLFLV
jgi:hypothetical protein